MKTIYAVSKGGYSDYRVLAMFETKAMAERASKLKGEDTYSDDYFVEEFTLWSASDPSPEVTTVFFGSVELYDDGTASQPHWHSTTSPEFDHWQVAAPRGRVKVRQVRAPMHQNKGGRFECFGSSNRAVRKTVSDVRAEHIALGPHRVPEKNVGGAK